MTLTEELAHARVEIDVLKANNEHLPFQLAQLKRLIYGHRAERIDTLAGAMTLPLFDQLALTPAAAPDVTTIPHHVRQKPTRKPIPDHLPREMVTLDLTQAEKACPCCGGERHHIGDAVSEKLDYVPAQLSVLQYRRPKYACSACEGQIAVAPLPLQPIEQGMAAPGLLAHIIVSKWADHLPLNRQAGMLKRHGIELSPNTLGDWVLACGELLKPLHARLCEIVRHSDILHTDDTIVPLAQKGGTKQARAWVYVDPHTRLAAYDFSETRAGEHPQAWLKGWHGYLVADAYSGYDALYANPAIREVACWAHVRRKFYDIAKLAPKRGLAHEAIDRIAVLYHADNALRELISDERRRRRAQDTRPLLDDFKCWLDLHHPQLLPKSPLAQAMAYALRNWAALIRHQEDGRLRLDNNLSEQALRPIAVGRGNWLFAGSVRGGQAAAVLLSLVHSCKLRDVNPYAYLKDVLTRYPSAKPADLDHLLPHRWVADHPAIPC